MKLAAKFALTAAAACLLPLSGAVQAQDEVTETEVEAAAEAAAENVAVLGVVDAFMAGLSDKDAEAMSAVALDTAFLAFVRPDDNGDALRTMPLSRAITSLAETVPDISEPIRDPQVMSDGSVAMVWAPYDFYVDGVRNHCGVNVFSLLNRDGTWLIASVVYSYLPEGCPEEGEDTGESTQMPDLVPEDPGVIIGDAVE